MLQYYTFEDLKWDNCPFHIFAGLNKTKMYKHVKCIIVQMYTYYHFIYN